MFRQSSTLTSNTAGGAGSNIHHRLEATTDLSMLALPPGGLGASLQSPTRGNTQNKTDNQPLPISDDTLLSCLRERFMSDIIYTALGPSALVAVNPHKSLSSSTGGGGYSAGGYGNTRTTLDGVNGGGDDTLRKYVKEYWDLSGQGWGVDLASLASSPLGGQGGQSDLIVQSQRLPPHIFQLANNAYYHMRRTGQDQCIIFNGETSSGKSTSHHLALLSLLALSSPPPPPTSSLNNQKPPKSKSAKLISQIPASQFVLESFGNARTLFNANASRFGKYTELQFLVSDGGASGTTTQSPFGFGASQTSNTPGGSAGSKCRLIGVKTLDYYLERNRVASVPSGERNFHIFYYLVAGASQEERMHLHLDGSGTGSGGGGGKAVWRYLGVSGRGAGRRGGVGGIGGLGLGGGGDDDASRFDQLKIALKTIGFSKRHVAQTCQLVAAILHLGNLEFVLDRGRNVDCASVRNIEALSLVASFLGVTASALEGALTSKTKLVKKELCTVFLDAESASDNRDDLAKTLYSLLFGWINEHINEKLCRDDFSAFIGTLDFPGSQNMSGRENGIDQFVVNYASERMRMWVMNGVFERGVGRKEDEYRSEGVYPVGNGIGAYVDNSECVRMLQNVPGGLIHIMDDQARRMPKKTDTSMVEAFAKRWGNHSCFKASIPEPSGAPNAHTSTGATFTIAHYNGPVTYSAEGFLERNLDALSPDFVSLLRGGHHGYAGEEGSGSMNPFVKGLFSAKAIATQAHPRNEDTIVAAQQAVKPMRTPSTRRRTGGGGKRVSAMPGVAEGEERDAYDEVPNALLSPTAPNFQSQQQQSGLQPCVAGEFRSALDTLFGTLDETQAWFVFCVNPNDSQLPNQLEGRSVKGQIRAMGLKDVAKWAASGAIFEVGMLRDEFGQRYFDGLRDAGVPVGRMRDAGDEDQRLVVDEARKTFGFEERDLVLGVHKVFLSQRAFHIFEDQLRARDVEELKRSRIVQAEGDNVRGFMDPFAIYRSPESNNDADNDWNANINLNNKKSHNKQGYSEAYALSSQALPLVQNASPFQRAEMYDDDYFDESKSVRSGAAHPNDEFDARSRFTSHRDDSVSHFGSESYAPSRNMFQNTDKRGLMEKEGHLAGEILEGETTEVLKESSARRRWVAFCWLLTWWIPTPCLRYVGRMKRMDVRQAWREKLALNLIIWFICACTVFVIAVLGVIICPTEHIFNSAELASHSFTLSPNNVFTSIRGEVFDLTSLAQTHLRVVSVVPVKSILKYGGENADSLFPVQVSALCDGVTGTVSPWVTLDSSNNSDVNSQYHDFRTFTNDSRPDWYFEQMVQMRYQARVGFIGMTPKEIRSHASAGHSIAVYRGLIYDVTTYLSSPPAVRVPAGTAAPSDTDVAFMSGDVLDLFKFNAGGDITKQLDNLGIDPAILARQKVCLRNLFLVGKVDNRQSPQCLFANYILLVLSVIMVAIIGFKFLASINFGASRAPEDHDKFVICQVPCYTEGDVSLRRTIDSLAQMKYDDKRKLLLVICDGMIVGSGNDRPTPRIVLDILGADPNLDPEPLSFVSLGEGAKQHNMGKVYSGLYECSGHVVPYLVVVKVGKPTERSRPGNRGKRDSQMMLMHFLNKVHFSSPMNPLELEMYHQIKNVIGVNPSFYEYLFMVDADTTVDPLSVNRLISAMIHDKKLLGACGETELANSKQSLITMMQVYEYFISHHMAKAFESLFGSVTCLPGCFTLYRLRTPDTHKPLLISNQIIQDYSENRVDTLHMKNLLHLGEDRYLTTLLLKHFPKFKTQFIRDAHAYTVAPDDWKVLLSQRRRWINSTVHNLGELIFLEQLCGFCCFSMRFVVMIDLLSTLTQPVTVAYIVYLIYLVAGLHKSIPTLSLIMIAAIYGVQALVFIMRRKWDMIGWMIFYIIAIPAFSFFLPLYSFWRMDDFSWGQTRVVMGEKGKKMIVHDEGKFDERLIPLKSWSDYENELWDKESNHSIGSWVPPKLKNEVGGAYPESRTASLYGRETYYEPQHQPRSFSPAPGAQMQLGLGIGGGPGVTTYPPPGYQSGRNTPQSHFHMDTSSFAAGVPLLSQQSLNMGGGGFLPPSRPVTNYLDVPIPSGRDDVDLLGTGANSGTPSDSDLEKAVHDILRTADLNSITKREIRRRIEEVWGVDLVTRKLVINAAIDRELGGSGS